ncbi:hypothetical protein PV326_013433, partial [Microctonus aethiopoides]
MEKVIVEYLKAYSPVLIYLDANNASMKLFDDDEEKNVMENDNFTSTTCRVHDIMKNEINIFDPMSGNINQQLLSSALYTGNVQALLKISALSPGIRKILLEYQKMLGFLRYIFSYLSENEHHLTPNEIEMAGKSIENEEIKKMVKKIVLKIQNPNKEYLAIENKINLLEIENEKIKKENVHLGKSLEEKSLQFITISDTLDEYLRDRKKNEDMIKKIMDNKILDYKIQIENLKKQLMIMASPPKNPSTSSTSLVSSTMEMAPHSLYDDTSAVAAASTLILPSIMNITTTSAEESINSKLLSIENGILKNKDEIIAQLENNNENLTLQNNKYIEEIKSLNLRLGEKEKFIDNINEKYRVLNNEYKSLSKKHAGSEEIYLKEFAHKDSQIKELKHNINVLDGNNKIYGAKIDTLNNEIIELNETYNNLIGNVGYKKVKNLRQIYQDYQIMHKEKGSSIVYVIEAFQSIMKLDPIILEYAKLMINIMNNDKFTFHNFRELILYIYNEDISFENLEMINVYKSRYDQYKHIHLDLNQPDQAFNIRFEQIKESLILYTNLKTDFIEYLLTHQFEKKLQEICINLSIGVDHSYIETLNFIEESTRRMIKENDTSNNHKENIDHHEERQKMRKIIQEKSLKLKSCNQSVKNLKIKLSHMNIKLNNKNKYYNKISEKNAKTKFYYIKIIRKKDDEIKRLENIIERCNNQRIEDTTLISKNELLVVNLTFDEIKFKLASRISLKRKQLALLPSSMTINVENVENGNNTIDVNNDGNNSEINQITLNNDPALDINASSSIKKRKIQRVTGVKSAGIAQPVQPVQQQQQQPSLSRNVQQPIQNSTIMTMELGNDEIVQDITNYLNENIQDYDEQSLPQ